MTERISRRTAVQSTLAAGAALSVPQIVPAAAFGANERLVMGIIGAGGRGQYIMRECQGMGAQFAAVCDVSDPRIESGLKRAQEENDRKVESYTDYRKLLERGDLDAVVIGTPEHQHCRQMVDAVQAGLDAYVEKPMSHTIEEGAWAVKEVRKTDRIVQIGMQRRSAPLIHEGLRVIRTGVLGKVHFVRAEWNWNISGPIDNSPLGYNIDWKRFQWPTKRVKFEPMKVRSWRQYWPFSGGLSCDQGTHIMDVVQWYMGGETPRVADCFGNNVNTTGAETPDVLSCLFRYPDYLATWTVNYNSTYGDWWHIHFQGEKGTMHLHRFGFEVYKEEPGKKIGEQPAREKADIEFKGDLPSRPHVENFIDCIKTRKEPNAPVEVGHTAVCGPHLGNVAMRKEKRARLNEKATKVRT